MFEKLLQILGHFHPVLVHIPIGTLVLTYILYRFNGHGNRRNMRHAISTGLFISCGAAVLSAICGLLLARQGGYDDGLLTWHKYLGFTVVGLSLVLWYIHQDIYKRDKTLTSTAFRWLFNLCMVALVIGGHLGGSLTHGKGYLFKSEARSVNSPPPTSATLNQPEAGQQKVFAEIIQPILKDKCTSCHNPDKKKGDLILTDSKGLLAGGKNGPVVKLGDPEASALYTNLQKPLDYDTHMPPDGKRQLTETEKDLIAWWIKNHTSFEDKVSDYPAFEGRLAIIPSGQDHNQFDFDLAAISPAEQKIVRNLQEDGYKVYSLTKDIPLLDVSLAFSKKIDRKTIAQLKRIQGQVYQLDLSNTGLTDEMTAEIPALPYLANLNLGHTGISDASLDDLARFPRLKKLNVFQTNITDAGLDKLKSLASLEHLYLWKTKTTKEGIAALQSSLPGLEIVSGINMDTLVKMKLPLPGIRTETNLFNDSIVVEMTSFFKDAELHYTLDGSDPGIQSPRYHQPLVLKEGADIRLIAFKDGWESSDTASLQVRKAGLKIKEVILPKDPAKRYQADGPGTLADLNLGSDPGDGKWLAYQGEDFVASLQLEASRPVSKVRINTIQNHGLWVFYPKAIEVEISGDGKTFQPVAKTNYGSPRKNDKGTTKLIEVSFPPAQAGYVRIILRNIGKNPSWHPQRGKPSWIFCDEMMVE